MASVTIDSGEFPLFRNIDFNHQPSRSKVYSAWLKAFEDMVPQALDKLADVVEDVYTYRLWEERRYSGPEEFLKEFGITGLNLDDPAKLIKELRKKDSQIKRRLLERNREIHAKREEGKTQQQIADEVGLSQRRVGQILEANPVMTEKTSKSKRERTIYQINSGTSPEVAARKIIDKFGIEFAMALSEALAKS